MPVQVVRGICALRFRHNVNERIVIVIKHILADAFQQGASEHIRNCKRPLATPALLTVLRKHKTFTLVIDVINGITAGTLLHDALCNDRCTYLLS